VPLPFSDDTFDLVASLEILEFTPNPRKTLVELVRVLRPGGWLLVTNRVGWEAPLILGKTYPRVQFPGFLKGLGLVEVEDFRWQKTYDLIWARKP
jgi:ubiquinone/menaquinone biosynthesis C-methylase UbiE